MVLYLTPSRRATAIASETRRAPIPPETPRLPQRASSPSTFMAIPEVSRETRSIEGHCDVARVAFAATSPTSSSTRLPKREHASSGARRARRGSGRRFDSPPTRPIFFGRLRTRISDAFVEFGRDRACFERARRVARARSRAHAGGEVFPRRFFFLSFFFFAARQHPVPAKPGSRSGRAVARSPPRANRPPTRERRDGTLVIPRFPPRSRARRGRGGRGATRPARDASANSANVSFSRSASGFFFATRFCFLHSQKTSSPLRALQTRESPRRRRSGRCGRMSSSSKR